MYERLGKGQKIVSCTKRGKHCDDTSDALKHIGRWVISVAESGNNKLQERLLSLITPTLAVFNNETMEENLSEMEAEKLLSKLLVRTALRMGKVESNKLKKERSHIVTLEKASMMGEKLGREVLFSHSEIQQNISQLENPSSYESYFNALPKIICGFFQALITVLQQQKQNVVNKKRLQRGLPPKSLNTSQISKTTALLTSMLLTIAFPGMKIWLSHMISSICQKPKLLPYLREILHSACIISYTKRHENRLEKFRMHHTDPRENLIEGSNIWNLAVIDNIDFKASTFSYGNIFDVT